ncbi:uncharacterized protein LOC117600127, partial [Osmia lignaria lignaria]|uniref:uncharacterized protein LOC117600127 n=1 Tax=Osmia lignaria lignaria TaxID=1437193 RepID=UPI0014789D79
GLPQDPTGSGSSSSSSSDLAESDDRNDDEDAHQLSQLTRHEEDPYESVASERSLEFLASRETPCDYRRRYDYTETALTDPAVSLQDYSSSSANSLDDLCRGQRMLGDFNRTDTSRDHYMVPTRDPREFNERILSLFNPQFLPNFNDMIMYVASQYDTRRTPPPRSRSMAEGEDRLFRNSSYYRKKRVVGAGSMFFRRGLTYEARK